MIDDLIALAVTLAAGASGTGRPKSVELRRAVSTAYYALFHALAQLSAAELVGVSKPWAIFSPIYRSLGHSRCRQVLDQIRKAQPTSDFASIAPIFAQLQDARHDADYNPAPFPLSRSETADLIAAARQAIEALRGLSSDRKLELAVRLVAAHKRTA